MAMKVDLMTQKQVGVATGMAIAVAVTAATLALPFVWPGFPAGPDDQAGTMRLWAYVTTGVAFWLLVSVARLAKHRFFTPEDIDGAAGPSETAKARMLQSMLQNTLEQSVLAIAVYGAWFALAPAETRLLPLLCMALFSLGRILFFWGYERGAVARSLGFALTFYPTVGLFILLLGFSTARLIGAAHAIPLQTTFGLDPAMLG